jgi:hypothetical protein
MTNSNLTFDPNNFHNNPITNAYMPLAPSDTWVYGDPADPQALDTVKVLNQTKLIDGVECVVVSDIAKEGNKTVEKTRDYFAQDDQGNVWYFGEDTRTFQAGGVDFEGTWRAGRVPDGGTELARPGIIMLADPQVGDSYFEENALPVAHDGATVVSLNATAETGLGTLRGLLHTENSDIEGAIEQKFYSPGIGFVRGEASDGTDVLLSFTSGHGSLTQAMASFGGQSSLAPASPSQKEEHTHFADITASPHSHHG